MIFVAGGGFYGATAVSKLKNRDTVVVVDVDKECRAKAYVECIAENLDEVLSGRCRSALVVGDAVEVFLDLVNKGFVPDVVVPAIPRHFAGEVTYSYLRFRGYIVKPYTGSLDEVIDIFKNFRAEAKADSSNGVIVASYMPFNLRCKTNCSEPQVCPVTGKVKAVPLHKLMMLALSKITNRVIVFESKLIAEGIGGFSGYEITEVLRDLSKPCCRSNLIAIATACMCHGLANLFLLE